MHARPPTPRQKKWGERLVRSGYFVGAIFLHLMVFLLVATVVIWKAPEPPVSTQFSSTSLKLPPPPVAPPSSGASASNPQLEPQQLVIPVVTPPSMITTTSPSAFKIDSAQMSEAISSASSQLPQGSGLGAAGGGTTLGIGSAFGSSTGSSAQLTGYFYDLKQTPDRKPTRLSEAQYLGFLAKYVNQGWDDSMLEPYYKSKSPLYAKYSAISTRPSAAAPEAFGLQNEVLPGLWVVHYHARVEPPGPGQYRFAGFADNVMVVKVNGTTVLDAGWDSLTQNPNLRQLLPFKFPSYARQASAKHIPNLKIGTTFQVDAAEAVDMDVLIGDSGGVCSFFLLIEKEGNPYEDTADGTPKYPFFQLGTGPAPTFSATEEHPPYSTTPEPWQSVSL